MDLVKKEKLNLKIKNVYNYPFEILESGQYLIEVIASARNWRQNLTGLKSFFKDDDLAVRIDSTEFPKMNGKKGLFDGEAAWNGNNLKGLSKSGIFIINLKEGKHTLEFLADQNPILESIAVFKITGTEISYVPDENNPAQEGNRRPWMTIILANLGVKSLQMKARAKSYLVDDDDIKLVIDGSIQKNEADKSHINWYWCGQVLGGQEKEFSQQLNWKTGLHYLELWADKTPVLDRMKLILRDNGGNKKKGRIAIYKDITTADHANLRKEYNADSEIISQLDDGSEVEIIKEIIEGENVQNYSKIWHKIKYHDVEGYVLSSFVEIEGQERERIVEKIRTQAKERGIDENYAIALAGCESKYKPYAVSFSGALGIFQLTRIARNDLRERFNFNINDEEGFNSDKNIEAGIIYLKWIFDIYKGAQDEYKKITAAWNAGTSLIPVEGAIRFNKIDDPAKRKEVMDLVNRVEENRKKKDWHFILFSLILIGLLSLGAGLYFAGEKELAMGKVLAVQDSREEIRYGDTKFRFDKPYPQIKSINIYGESPRTAEWYTNIVIEHDGGRIVRKKYSGFLDNAYMLNIVSFTRELVIVRQEGKQIMTSILAYDQQSKSLEDIKFVHLDGSESINLCCSYIILKPLLNGVQHDLAVRYLLGEYESLYEYEFSNFSEKFFLEKEARKTKKELQP